MGDAVEPKPMQADLPMQSDPDAPATFKDIVSQHRRCQQTQRVVPRPLCQDRWAVRHVTWAAPCTTSTIPDHDPAAAHLVHDQGWRAKKGCCILGGSPATGSRL
eukprot:1290681-Pleurochrysis_carterae.AAC.2